METLLGGFDQFETPKDRSEIIKAPFAYPGGKQRSVVELMKHLPVEESWVDCCGGSGVVTLNRPKSNLEVYNDRWSALTDFYRVIVDEELFEQFLGLLDVSVHSRELWEWAHVAQHDAKDPLKRAFAWYYNVIYSFSSLGRNFGRSLRGNNALAKKIDKKLTHFKFIHERFKHVQIENDSVINILKSYDDYATVFYIDPPYYPESPGVYKHTMKKADHVKMLNAVFECKGFVAVSGYENDLYDTYPWDDVKEWDSMVSMNSPGLEGNNKQNIVINHERENAKENLWIKEAR